MRPVAPLPFEDWTSSALTSTAPPQLALDSFREAMQRHGIPTNIVVDVFDALADVSLEAAATTVTQAEREFALSAGVPEAAFSREATATNRLYEIRSALADRAETSRNLLTTEQVGVLLGITGDNVRQQAQRGSLYSAGQIGTQKAFPTWQFKDGRPLPGLRDVIAAMPAEFHPADIAAVMLEADESLGNRTPREWLSTGGPIAPVVELVSDLSYT